jgi:hypothetical protein
MARDQNETVPCWQDLPAAHRRRLAVLIGRLALRRLPLAPPAEGTEGEAADEGHAGPRDRSDAPGQDPRPPP